MPYSRTGLDYVSGAGIWRRAGVGAGSFLAATHPTGWALIATPTEKERRFCRKQGIEVIECELSALSGSLVAV